MAKTRMIRFLTAIVLVSLILPGPVWSDRGQDYKSILKRWTRDDEAYNWSSIEARLVWYATYLSPSFRRARTRHYAELYELGASEISKLESEEEAAAQQYDSFFISVYVGSRVHKDIGKDRSLWRLVLETPDRAVVEPTAWEEVPTNQVTRTLFPYIDRWSKTYEVKFPKVISEQTEWAHLKMVGVPADSILDWNLKKIRHKT